MLHIASQTSNTSPTLLAGLACHDAAAWEQFVVRYTPTIHAWIRRKGVGETDACDVTQNVMLKLFDALGERRYDRTKGRFRAWLKTIVANATQDWFRRALRYREVLTEMDASPGEDSLEQAIEDEYQKELFERAAEVAAGQVQQHTWIAFERTALKQDPPSEVAEALGISIAQIYVAKNRVLGRIRKIVSELAELDDRLM